MTSSTTTTTDNLNVVGLDDMPPPVQIKQGLPLSDVAEATVQRGRAELTRILDRLDARLFVVVGPCSIHDRVPRSSTRSVCARWPRTWATCCCW